MISTEMYRELLKRENLSRGLLRQKIAVLKSQVGSIQAHQDNTTVYGSDGWDEMDTILEDRNSEIRKVVRQIAISHYGHLEIAQIAKRWNECNTNQRCIMVSALPKFYRLNFTPNELKYYYPEYISKWDELHWEVRAEFEKFALDGKKSTEAVI